MDVYVMESGEYEQRHVCGVFSSIDAARRDLERTYAPPYRVTWREESTEDGGRHAFIGEFEGVMGLSTPHTGTYDLTRTTVDAPA